MQNSTEILDQTAIRRALTRISSEIVEKNRGSKDLVLAGIRTRGVPMAARLADKIGEVEGAMSSLSIVVAGLLTVVGASIFANLM